MDSDKVLVPSALEQEAASIIERYARLIQQGVTCCVSTKRTVLTLPDDTPETALVRSVAISDALQSCVGKLPVTPAFVVAKGGITSSAAGSARPGAGPDSPRHPRLADRAGKPLPRYPLCDFPRQRG